MDNPSLKPGIFTFAQRPAPTGNGPWEKVANLLRQSGFVVLIGGGLSVLAQLLFYWQSMTYNYAGGGLFGLVFGIAWVAAGLFWISFTYHNWCNRVEAGWKHSQILAIVMAILGGLGVLGGLMAFGVYAAISALVPMLGIWFMVQTLVGLLASAAYIYFGINILTNRNKPECQAAFGVATAPPPGMTN